MRYTLSSARQLAGYAFDPSQPAGLVQSAEFQLLCIQTQFPCLQT